jgi:hypothetical protein
MNQMDVRLLKSETTKRRGVASLVNLFSFIQKKKETCAAAKRFSRKSTFCDSDAFSFDTRNTPDI